MDKLPHFDLTQQVIGAAIEVHRALGPGLLESAYEACLCVELQAMRIAFERQVPVLVNYKGTKIDASYRIDVLVQNTIVLELKSVEQLTAVHEAQLLTYLKLSRKRVGLLINFNTELLKHGIVRRVV